MKKVVIVLCIVTILAVFGASGFYVWGLTPKSTDTKEVTFVIEPGTSKTTVAKNLEMAGLIHNKYVLDVYFYFVESNIQAGEYILSPSMSPEEMIHKFEIGDVKINTISVTFIEGKRITDYANAVSEKLKMTKEEFLNTAGDLEYLQELVSSNRFWFLSDSILSNQLYYPLEGYLYPDTYEFLENASPKDVIEALLNQTAKKLEPYKEAVINSNHSIHEILTMASIVEKEANSEQDRKNAAQVFYSRLNSNMSLGSDVTAFYGARKEMGKDAETYDVLYNVNPYNTRLTDGSMNGKLPIGPIANPSITSIEAALNPSSTNYYYFVANVCTGEVFFQEDYTEFISKVRELQNICSAN